MKAISWSHKKELLPHFEAILVKVARHQTIDTYAKKIYLAKGGGSFELDALKYLLALYFQFEQHELKGRIVSTQDQEIHINQKEYFREGKFKAIDPRYDVFLATHLQAQSGGNMPELAEGINVVSWNFDSQIEIAYQEFANCNLRYAREKLRVWPSCGEESGSFRIVKLNGCADILEPVQGKQYVDYSLVEPSAPEGFTLTVDDHLEYFLQYSNTLIDRTVYHRSLISFAWELSSSSISRKSLEYAKSILNDTEILVNVGYSFPPFNREIDEQLLTSLGAGEIIVQDCEPSVPAGRIRRILEKIGRESIKVVEVSEVNEFFLP